jgi:alpha-tubulin suppressor-like RCC1 family protein
MAIKGRSFLLLIVIFAIALLAIPVSASAANIVSIFSGHQANFAIADDGTVWAWGTNTNGQLGDGTKTAKETPFKHTGLSNVKAISSDGSHTVVLKNDGSVWACGKNDNGQLGDGTQESRMTFVQMQKLADIVAIDANEDLTLALKNDGTVWVCGEYAPSGSWTSTRNVTVPEMVAGLSNIKAISVGSWHFLALDGSGNVWGWGNNINGQLSSSASVNQATPVKMTGLTDVRGISAGYQNSMFLKNDGTVWALGWNNQGVQGTGQKGTNAKTPVQVSTLSGMVDVDAGNEATIALKNDGTIWVWGYNPPGAWSLNKTSQAIWEPMMVPGFSDIKAISSKIGKLLLALANNGTVWAPGGPYVKNPDTGISGPANSYMIRFVAGTSQATGTPTAAQPTATGATPAATGKQTPAPSALIAVGILAIVAVFSMRKK